MFKEADESGAKESMSKISQNYKALLGIDKNDLVTLSKVIENSIVFGLSKQGRFSKFKNSSHNNKRNRKFMIGMAQEANAHIYSDEGDDQIKGDSEDEGFLELPTRKGAKPSQFSPNSKSRTASLKVRRPSISSSRKPTDESPVISNSPKTVSS